MDVLWEIAGFAAKGFIVVVVVAICAFLIAGLLRGGRDAGPDGKLEVKRIDHRLRKLADELRCVMMPPKELKKYVKLQAKEDKAEARNLPSVFVLDFKGDLMANAAESLRHEISALLGVAKDDDEVVLRLESPGGAAHGYGFAASQLARLKENKVKLTVCVDKVAASGGYMMACVADQILVAPFAIVGSIGVAAPVPNIHRLLESHGVDYENVTAGKYKRTVSMLGEITEEGRKKFQEQIEETHGLFKNFVHEHRPALDIEAVATGEYWHGVRATELGLANRLTTSDDYLMSKVGEARLFEVVYSRRQPLAARLANVASSLSASVVDTVWSRLSKLRF